MGSFLSPTLLLIKKSQNIDSPFEKYKWLNAMFLHVWHLLPLFLAAADLADLPLLFR